MFLNCISLIHFPDISRWVLEKKFKNLKIFNP